MREMFVEKVWAVEVKIAQAFFYRHNEYRVNPVHE